MMPVARQWALFTHQWINLEVVFSAQSVRQLHEVTMEELLGDVFYVGSMPRCYKQDKSRVLVVMR
jgi:hypothetical protein